MHQTQDITRDPIATIEPTRPFDRDLPVFRFNLHGRS
jgi:hypothetical protein